MTTTMTSTRFFKGLIIQLSLLFATVCEGQGSISPVEMTCDQIKFNVCLNDDNDNGNTGNDRPDLDEQSVPDEDDLIPLKFNHPSAKVVKIQKINFLGDGRGALWKDKTKGTQLKPTDANPVVLPLPVTVYFEGTRVSNPLEDICFEYHYFKDASDQNPVCGGSACATVYAIESVEYRPISGSPLGTNPNAGGGKRIFPGRPSMTGTTQEVVHVEAKIIPVIEGIEIYFKTFDVDDPSSRSAPVDNETQQQDNRGTPKEGRLGGSGPLASAKTDKEGRARVEFSSTFQPGDNFRAVVSCSNRYLDQDLKAKQNDGNAARIEDKGKIIIPNGGRASHAKATGLLTVWRKLHMELDSMVPPDKLQNSVSGTIQDVARGTLPNSYLIMLSQLFDKTDRYEGGVLRVGAVDYHVIESLRRRGAQEEVTILLAPGQTAAANGASYTIFDDDLNAWPARFPNTGHMATAFRPAYVDPVILNQAATVPFVENIANAMDLRNAVSGSFTHTNSNEFWVTHLVSCFQPHEDFDLDPDPILPAGRTFAINNAETPIEGLTPILRPDNLSGIFEEVLRETASNASHVVVHEVARQFGAQPADGGIMTVRRGLPSAFGGTSFTPTTLDRIRDAKSP